MLIAAMSTIAKLWKESRCASRGEWIKMWYIYTMEYYAAIKSIPKILPFQNDMGGTRGYYAKQNKSIIERQLSYDLPDRRKWRCNVGGLAGRKRINRMYTHSHTHTHTHTQ